MADGSELATFFEENRTYVALEQISPLMQKAQIAIEDHRFYEHGAIDLQGLGRAFIRTLSGSTQGASTLTQQYIKNYYVDTTSSYVGKFQQAIMAIKIDRERPKEQILGSYLNTVYFGRTTRSEERRVGKECRSRWSPYH